MNRPRLVLIALILTAAASTSASAETTKYAVDAEKSRVTVHVGKSGAFSFAGHKHDIAATKLNGEVVAVTEDLGKSSVTLTFESAGLQVSEKEEGSDAPKVQETMTGPKLLDVASFPKITFKSTHVAGKAAADGAYDLDVTGDLTLHGVTKPIEVKVHVVVKDNALEATGEAPLRQTAFGLKPIAAGGGAVKVKDEVGVEFQIVASRR